MIQTKKSSNKVWKWLAGIFLVLIIIFGGAAVVLQLKMETAAYREN